MIKLSDYLLQKLSDFGVRHVFMLPGGGAMHLNDSLGKSGIPYTCNLHEQACAIAAEAYAKATGEMGAVMVTSGPGGTNTVTGVAGAWLDSTPCFFVSGQVKKSDLKGDSGLRQLGVQEVDIVSIVAPITKYAVTVSDASTIRYHLEKALYLANNGRPGPVWLDIPMDVQAAMLDVESLPAFDPAAESESASGVLQARQEELQAAVSRFIALLNEAERPVILAGNGVRLAGALPLLREVIERLDIPVLTTWLAGDFLPEAHPLFVGRPGGMAPRGANFALQNCDLLLNIGSRLDMVMTGYAHDRFAREAKKIVVDIDPAEIAKLHMPLEVAICADARDFLELVLKSEIENRNRADWKKRCGEWKEKYPIIQSEYRDLKEGVSTYYLAEILSQEIPASAAVVSGSSGTGIEIFLHTFQPRPGQRVIFSPGLGAMGFGLPAAIGACIGKNKALTVCVNGEGGFQMNIQELQTVARLQLPIKFFILDNEGYASIRNSQLAYFGDNLVAADATSGLTLPNMTKIAAAYGLATARITSQKNLAEEVRAILAAPGPCLCEISTPRDEPRAPRISTFQREDGTMVSKPLEDLWPFLERDEFLSNMIVAPIEE